MPDLSKLMRHKRFNLRDDKGVSLVVETNTGTRFTLAVTNVSLTGIGASHEGPLSSTDGIDMGSLIPASKLTLENQEIPLGRLVIRRVVADGAKYYLAFSTIDSRVPVDGMLSKYIDTEFHQRKSAFDFELSHQKFSLRSFHEGSHANVDLFHRAEQFDVFLREWKESSKFQYHNVRTPSKGGRVKLRHRRKGARNDFLVMASNDYLGLASHPEVAEAAKKAIDDYGFGSTGSPLTTGLTDLHEELCDFVAKMFHKDKAMLFNSGYTANVGALTGLTAAQDLIVADFLSHASIQDGMQMSQATSRFFKHNDAKHLDRVLRDHRKSHMGSLIVTEGVFSMDGDVPPLPDIAKLCNKHNSRLFLDEAHSFGVIGPTGLGCWEKYPDAKVDILMGTFSKICGGIGGFVASNEEVINWLRYYARSFMFSVSLPPSTVAAALTALKLFQSTPELVKSLQGNIRHFVNGLRQLGCPISENHESAVIPVTIGNEEKLGKINDQLRENGVYVIPLTYPAVAKNSCRFRFTMMSSHTITDLDYVLNALERAFEKADFRFEELEEPESLSDAA